MSPIINGHENTRVTYARVKFSARLISDDQVLSYLSSAPCLERHVPPSSMPSSHPGSSEYRSEDTKDEIEVCVQLDGG